MGTNHKDEVQALSKDAGMLIFSSLLREVSLKSLQQKCTLTTAVLLCQEFRKIAFQGQEK